jgi:2-C-methyl-D-erythritol 2,4-cyclodiphosphate synthase
MIRIGKSTDLHLLDFGKPLIIGGVHIPYEKGNVGHSDGDCLLHTVCESLLGAIALGDLGSLYPDNDDRYSGISSSILVKNAMKLVKSKGYTVVNIDSTVFLQQPKIQKYIHQMRREIASLLDLNIDFVSVKATTMEGVGPVGEGKAIMAESIVLLTDHNK